MYRFIPTLILVIALAAAVWAANPAQILTQYGLFFTGASGEPQPVTAANPLPVDLVSGSISLGSVTADINTQYVATDTSNRTVVNVGSWTAGPIQTTVLNTLPTVDNGGAGKVSPKGATSAASQRWLVASSGQSWTLSASATDFTLFNLGSNTVYFDINMGGATVGASIPLTATGTGQCQQGRDAAEGMVVNLIAATPTYVLGVEGRR